MGPNAVRRQHRGMLHGQRTVRPFPVLPSGGAEQFGELSGFSLKKIGKALAPKNVFKQVKKAVVDTGHFVGKVADNKIVKGVVAAGLAATGVGVGASTAIMGTMGATGGALKKGGGLKKAVKGGVTGAAVGAASGVAGKLLPKIPGLSKPLTALRTKVGTIKVPKPVSYASDGVLDKLSSGALPDVGITPSEGASVVSRMKPISPSRNSFAQNAARDLAIDTAKKKGAEALRISTVEADALQKQAGAATKAAHAESDPAKKKSLLDKASDFLKKASTKKTAGAAAQMAATLLTEPSANPISPQGGYSPPADEDSQRPAQAGVSGIFSNPMALAAVAGVAVLLIATNKGGK